MYGNLVRQSEGTDALWPLLQLAPLHAALASPLPLSPLVGGGGGQEILEAIFGVVKLSLNVQVEHPPPSLLPHSLTPANLVRREEPDCAAGDNSSPEPKNIL